MGGRSLVFTQLDSGCYVQLTHKLNQDGYFRKGWGNPRSGDRITEMFHRTMWRLHNGDIPDGHEVDHMCGNRACCNIEHLRCIPGLQHTIETNQNRWKWRRAV